MAAEKDRTENTHGLSALKDNIRTILFGSKKERERLRGQFFHIADTPEFMKKLGLTGDYFSIRYGVISRHLGKDKDHDLSEQNWLDLCKAITEPFTITKYDKGYRLFTSIKFDENLAAIGINIKTIRKGLEVNSICTVFKYNQRNQVNDEIIYKS